MIEPERILYYFENVALWLAETEPDRADDEWSAVHLRRVRNLMRNFYQFCHIATPHKCEHPDWEADFLFEETALVESGWMKPWEERKAEVIREGYKAFASFPVKRGI